MGAAWFTMYYVYIIIILYNIYYTGPISTIMIIIQGYEKNKNDSSDLKMLNYLYFLC